jgi:streptomycin 6-kinase
VELPADFSARIRGAYPNGAEWLAQLPTLVERAAQRWGLTDIRPVPNLSYNFVAFARAAARSNPASQGRAAEVVLKIGPPNPELASEMAALRLYEGRGCCGLLEADQGDYAFLIERLLPGLMLSDLEDDERATHIAAEVMQRLWQMSPSNSPHLQGNWGEGQGEVFNQLSDWFAALDELRPRFEGGTGPFPKELVERVEALLPELFADPLVPVLMHGDFHHFNVLSSERGWLAIDPKGVIGPRGYECGPLLINPWDDFARRADAVALTQRRVAILSERLGLERETILGWGIGHSLLSAWWDFDSGDWTYSTRCGEIFLQTSP